MCTHNPISYFDRYPTTTTTKKSQASWGRVEMKPT
jgi:hypothetical protein